MRVAILLLVFASGAFSQAARGVYTHERTTVGSSETSTLHLPTGDRNARLVGVTVYCASTCTAALARDGAAPTSTAATANKLNTGTAAAAVVPYNASNVGAGTTIKNYNIAAGQELGIELTDKGLLGGQNVSITVSLSGARVFWQWREY